MGQKSETGIAMSALSAIPIPSQILEKNSPELHGLVKLYRYLGPALLGLTGYGALALLNAMADTGEGDMKVKFVRSAANILFSLVQIEPTTSSNMAEIGARAIASGLMIGSGGGAISMLRNRNIHSKEREASILEIAASGEVIQEDVIIGGESDEDVPQLVVNNHCVVVAEKTNPFINELGGKMLEEQRSTVLIGAKHFPYANRKAGKVLWPVWINTEDSSNRKVQKVANFENANELIVFTQKKDNLFLVDANNSDEMGISVTQALETIVEAYHQKPKGLKDTLSTLLFLPSKGPVHIPKVGDIDPETYLLKHGVPNGAVKINYIDELITNSEEVKANISKGAKIAKVADEKYDKRLDPFIEKLGGESCEDPNEADVVLVYSKNDNDVNFQATAASDTFNKTTIAFLDTEESLAKFKKKSNVVPICIQTLVSEAIQRFEKQRLVEHPPTQAFDEKPNTILAKVLEPVLVNKLTNGFLLETVAALNIFKNMRKGELERILSLLPEVSAKIETSEGTWLSPMIFLAYVLAQFNRETRIIMNDKIAALKARMLKWENLPIPEERKDFKRRFHDKHKYHGLSSTALIVEDMKEAGLSSTVDRVAAAYFHTKTPTTEQLEETRLILEASYQLGLVFKTNVRLPWETKDDSPKTVYARYDAIPIKESLDIIGV